MPTCRNDRCVLYPAEMNAASSPSVLLPRLPAAPDRLRSTRSAASFATLICLTLAVHCAGPVSAAPLPRAFSHNDYQHPRPLLDALEQGFCSVEADIYPVDGKLLVAHDRDRTQPDRTLEGLYLQPLHKRVEGNGGRVFPGGSEFLLLIDIKASADESYRLLRPLLEKHAAMLTRFTASATITGAVTVILSGDRPIELLRRETNRWCALDGRLPDLDTNPSPHLFPLVSASWRPTFSWMENEFSRIGP